MKKMIPKVIVHNSISLDGSLTNFEPNMELHYRLAGAYKPQAHLVGSNTIKIGVELCQKGIPAEDERTLANLKDVEACPTGSYLIRRES